MYVVSEAKVRLLYFSNRLWFISKYEILTRYGYLFLYSAAVHPSAARATPLTLRRTTNDAGTYRREGIAQRASARDTKVGLRPWVTPGSPL